jgi:hypothetical protein
MSTTLTVRVDPRRQRLLSRRAKAERTTVSELVREILDRALVERATGERVGHLRARLRLAPPEDPLRRAIKARNWRT